MTEVGGMKLIDMNEDEEGDGPQQVPLGKLIR